MKNLRETTTVNRLDVAEGVLVFLGEQGMPNAVCVVGTTGVVVVDSLFTPRHAAEMMRQLREVTDLPVLALVNTHFHGDHTLGNSVIPTDRIIAHRASYERLRDDGRDYLELLCGIRPDLAPEIAGLEFLLPTEYVQDLTVLDLGDVRVQIRPLGHVAHTAGDLIVDVPERNVLIASDLVFNGILPVARDADLAGLRNALLQLEDFARGRIVVPGHGPVGGAELIRRQISVLDSIDRHTRRALLTTADTDEIERAVLSQIEPMLHAEERIGVYVRQIVQSGTDVEPATARQW